MTQKALFFTTNGTGDGATEYTQAELFNWIHRSFGEGILRNYLYELEVTNVGRTCSIGEGAANIQGAPYLNDATVTITLPLSTVGTTGHRIVLRKSYAAQTVRITLLSSSDGVGTAPSPVQTAGTTWDLTLCTATVTTGGDVTLTDARTYAVANVSAAITDGSITTAKLADNSVTLAKHAHTIRIQTQDTSTPQHWGGYPAQYPTFVANYAPTSGHMQAGSLLFEGDTTTVSFPVAFGGIPLVVTNLRYDVIAGPDPDPPYGTNESDYRIYDITASGFVLSKLTVEPFVLTWIAFGSGA